MLTIIYTDESVDRGKYFSDFYGGVLVRSTDIDFVRQRLNAKKEELGFHGEVKWIKVTENYLNKYMALMDLFFEFIAQDLLKVRIMFTQNRNVPQGLESYHTEYKYYILYYQFIKHAFGLPYANSSSDPITLRLYFDRLPDEKAKVAIFRAHLLGLARMSPFRKANLLMNEDQIAQVDSHNHVILQCLDIVLGAVQFRLNDKHLEKADGALRRGKRTVAKEALYKHIHRHIQNIYQNFNVGISTGMQGNRTNLWHHRYRHWLFIPKNSVIDPTQHKANKK